MATDRRWIAALAAAFVFVSTPALAQSPEKPPDAAKDRQVGPERSRRSAPSSRRTTASAPTPSFRPLTLDPKLTAAAQAHADDMAAHQKMTHDGSDGSTPSDRIKRQGYQFQNEGENVAEGYRTVET